MGKASTSIQQLPNSIPAAPGSSNPIPIADYAKFSDALSEVRILARKDDPKLTDTLRPLTICFSSASEISSSDLDAMSDGDMNAAFEQGLQAHMVCIESWYRDLEVKATVDPGGNEAEVLKGLKIQLRKRGINTEFFTKPWSEKTRGDRIKTALIIGTMCVGTLSTLGIASCFAAHTFRKHVQGTPQDAQGVWGALGRRMDGAQNRAIEDELEGYEFSLGESSERSEGGDSGSDEA